MVYLFILIHPLLFLLFLFAFKDFILGSLNRHLEVVPFTIGKCKIRLFFWEEGWLLYFYLLDNINTYIVYRIYIHWSWRRQGTEQVMKLKVEEAQWTELIFLSSLPLSLSSTIFFCNFTTFQVARSKSWISEWERPI